MYEQVQAIQIHKASTVPIFNYTVLHQNLPRFKALHSQLYNG